MRPATRLPRPVVIGHRGAPAYRPEHTAASFELAIDLGAELIEPDVVVSRDGVLVVRHESELSLSTDVAARAGVRRPPHHQARSTATPCTGWFTEDFTLAELRTLRAVERMPDAAAAEHRLRRPLRHPDPRRGRRAGPHAGRRADRQIRVLAELKTPDWPDDARPADGRAGQPRSCAGSDATDAHGPGAAAVVRRRPCCATLRARLGDDGPQMVQLVDDGAEGDRDGHAAPGCARSPPTRRAIAPSRDRILAGDAAGRRPALPRWSTRRTAPRCRSSAGRCGRRTPSCPSTCAAATRPTPSATPSPRPAQLLDLGVDGLITDSPDLAVRAVRSCRRAWSDRTAARCRRARGVRERPAARDPPAASPAAQSIRSWMTTFSSRPGPTPITLIRAPESSSSRRT